MSEIKSRDLAKCFFVVLAIICIEPILFPPPAYAYVDPSVMTYTIQALAGVAVALGAVASVAFRRTRKKIMQLMNIDENAGKEVEHDVHRVGPSGVVILDDDETNAPSAVDYSARRAAKSKDAEKVRVLTWPKRLIISFIAAAFLIYTMFVVTPYEMVASSSNSLVFGLTDIWAPIAVSAIILTVCLALVLSLFRGKVFDVIIAVIVAVGLCAYIQAMFLNISLPSADGAAVVWEDYTMITVVSAAVWIAIVAIFIGFGALRGRLFRGVAMVLCVGLISVQSVAVASLFLTPPSANAATGAVVEQPTVTEDGLFDVSDKSNVIVFILDKFDTAEMEHLLDSNPDLLDSFTNFTYFPDSTGSMVPTMFAVPYLVTGELPVEGEEFTQYVDQRYARSTFLDDIVAQGYSAGVYSDSTWGDLTQIADKTVNIHPLGETKNALDSEGAVRMLYQSSLYRDLPWFLKSPFWFYTDEVNKAMVKQDSGAGGEDIPYTIDDLRYYDSLVSKGLTVDEDSTNGVFRMIHLNGSHEPYVMDENSQPVASGTSTRDEQSVGVLGIVGEYIAQLKEKGLYEQSTIVVMADHGDWYISRDPITEPTSPLMLVKPAGGTDGQEIPCVISDIPVSHMDFPATVIDAIGGDSSKYGSGVFAISDTDRTRYYYMTTTDYDSNYVNEIIEFEITGPVSDFNNWHLTGNKWYYDSSNYQ